MTLTQLRTFLAVADAGSSHVAADRLFVTQSAVSASLSALQRSLGVQLVRRAGRGLQLTEAGEIYADYVRRVLGLLDEAENVVESEADPERGLLRLAAVTTAGEQIVPHLLATFRESHPRMGVHLEVGNREHVRTLLERRQVDLLISGRPAADRDVAVLGVRPHELVIVALPHALDEIAHTDPVTWAHRQTWLLREKGSATRRTTERFLAGLDLPHRLRTLTVGSNAAIRESVVAGLGVTLISRDAVAREIANQTLTEVPLPGAPLPRDWHLTANPGKLSATAAALVSHVLLTGEFQRPPDSGPAPEAQAGSLRTSADGAGPVSVR